MLLSRPIEDAAQREDGTPEPQCESGVSTTHHVKDSLHRPRKATGLPKTLPSTLYRWRYLRLRSANPLIWRMLRVRYRTCVLSHLEAGGHSDDERELALVNIDDGSRRRAKRKDASRKKQ